MKAIPSPLSRPVRLALALSQAAVLLLASPLAQGVVYVNGAYSLDPWDPMPLGPGDVDKPGSRFFVGTGADGSFSVEAGSLFRVGLLNMGSGRTGHGSATITGAGSRLELAGDGNANRLEIGNYGVGALHIMDGAVLDGRVNAAACLVGPRLCNNFVGQAAGSNGGLHVLGAGSEARLLNDFAVASFGLEPGWGTPGADSNGNLSVAFGGTLRTDRGTVARYTASALGTGTERAIGWATVDGENSLWQVGTGEAGSGTSLDFGVGANAQGYLQVWNGGRVIVDAGAGGHHSVRFGAGGYGQLVIEGAGSALLMPGDADKGAFRFGEGSGGVAAGWISKGGLLQTRSLLIGAGGGTGRLTLDGSGSKLEIGAAGASRLTVGDWGRGELIVSGGALLDATVDAAACASQWCDSFLGSAAGSTALLRVTGAGSEARFLGQLSLGGTAVSTPAVDGWTYGVPGGVTEAKLEVLNGGVLRSERIAMGGGWGYQPSATGGERSFSEILVSGTGAALWITGSAAAGIDAYLNTATQRMAEARVRVEAGGRLAVVAEPGRGASVDLSAGPGPGTGGKSWLTVDGSGSRMDVIGEQQSRVVVGNASGGTASLVLGNGGLLHQSSPANSYLNIGETGAVGTMEILSGGRAEGARSVSVGSGGTGSLLIDGSGSVLTTERVAGSNAGQIAVGSAGSGTLTVRNGGLASAFSLGVGNGWDRSPGSVLLDGAGSRIELDGVDWHRLSVNQGSLTVSGGAVLDATINAAACAGHWCGTFIANNAGDEARFTVTGAGSRASFLGGFNVGQAYATAPPENPWTLGHPGETSKVTLEVLAGGRLETEGARIAQGPSGGAVLGSEGVQVNVQISGAGSVWDVRSGADDGGMAIFSTGISNGSNTQSDVQIRAGGQLVLHADESHAAYVQLGASGGQNSLLISGAGSALVYGASNNAGFWVGRNGAQASVKLESGGQIQGINRLQVGNTGAVGLLTVDGAGSAISYGAGFADLYVGRQGGTGSATLSRGGRIDMQGNAFTRLYVGDGTGADGASGTLRIDGAGSVLALQSPAFAAGSGGQNPTGHVGWGGTGTVQIVNGGQLTLLGQGESTAAAISNTRLTIGQGISGVIGVGTVSVSGAGSLLSVTGVDPIVYVGRSGGFGNLSINSGAEMRTTVLDVGAQGATGNLNVNRATLSLSGQWASSELGAILALGFGSGSLGSAFIGNDSTLTISNTGTAGAGLLLGGINGSPKGSGVLQVQNNSHVLIEGPQGASAFIVGLGGSGIATFDSGSSLNIASGDVYIGRDAEAVGTLKLLGASALTAAYVGVGSTQTGDGGVGTLIVNDSTLNAGTLEIGARGLVGGNGTLNANVVNRGVFNPGNSPGTLTIAGSFTNQAGGRLVLEVESDGLGGFKTDELVFADASLVDLSGLAITFHFLGATDPNAFQASGGFSIDNFFALQGGGELDPAKFGSASFSASADGYTIGDFSFSPDAGASFTAVPVPEPGAWMLMMAGLGWTMFVARRRAGRRAGRGGLR